MKTRWEVKVYPLINHGLFSDIWQKSDESSTGIQVQFLKGDNPRLSDTLE
jgi:hypothetical protein